MEFGPLGALSVGSAGGRLPAGVTLTSSVPAGPLALDGYIGALFDPRLANPTAEVLTRSISDSPPQCAPTFVLELRPGVIHVPSSLVATSTHWLTDSMRSVGLLERFGIAIDRASPNWPVHLPQPVEVDEEVVVICGQNDRNYFHWWIECLSRLANDARLIESDLRIATHRLTNGQWEALAVLGLDASRVLELGEGTWRFRRIVFPSRGLTAMSDMSARGVAYLAQATARKAPFRRIYLSREDATFRRVLNDADVSQALASLGFERVLATDLTVREQVSLFGEAQAVIAPHGAGLVNSVFSCSSTTILELAPEHQTRWAAAMFRTLAALRRQPYAALVCPTHATNPSARRIPQNGDIVVDIPMLRAAVSLLTAASEARGVRHTAPSSNLG